MRRILIVAPLLLAACGTLRRGQDPALIGPSDLVVCVRNALEGYGNIRARVAQARFDVMPGSTSCRRIPTTSRVSLTASTIGGGAAGPLSFTDVLPSSMPGCWVWQLGPSRASSVQPMECDEVPGLRGGAPRHQGSPRLASVSRPRT